MEQKENLQMELLVTHIIYSGRRELATFLSFLL